nr:AsmA family protein [Gammaproteobacteria bacterium]
MKFLKRLVLGLVGLIVLLAVVVVVVLNFVDLNDYKDRIENITKTQTGRDLAITGDLNLSYFPWVGISLGELELANAEGFEGAPFARIENANVKIEVLPLLRKVVNVKTVELRGLQMDLQRAADGTTNWDDLANGEPATTSTTENDTTTEVEGDPAAIAALAVGGIEISDALISWQDDQAGVDAKLSEFNLTTGAIELAKPFALTTDFKVNSDSSGVAATVKGAGDVTLDLDQQRYSLANFTLETDAAGDILPGGKLDLSFGSSVVADLTAQTVDATDISLKVLGLALSGKAAVTGLDTEPQVSANLASDTFNLKTVFEKLGIEAPVTADENAMSAASLSLSLAASPAAATLNDLTIKLDDTTFTGSAELPNLAAAMPPARFKFGVDAINLDRYLPPTSDAPAEETATAETQDSAPAEDIPIELPLDLLRQLDVAGTFSVGELTIMNLTTRNIEVPLNAAGGVIALENIAASLYDGTLSSTMSLNAQNDTPAYAFLAALTKVESDPLLADLRQADSPLTGNANFNADITTQGNSVNGLKSGLNGSFDAAFLDGSINGINIGYQLRRAKAAIKGQSLSDDAKQVKTDFSSLSVSGSIKDGVISTDDLDMRSPLLRLSGAGVVDLPQEYLDYTPSVLVTGSVEGQGGKDLEELKGVQLDVPIKGKFDELSADFTGVLLAGLKDNITGAAKAKAKAAAEKVKAEAKAKLDAEKAKAQERLNAEKAAAKEKA